MKPKLNIIDDYNVKRKVVASFTFSVNLANTISEDTNQGKTLLIRIPQKQKALLILFF
jgi:hypothetical protein